MNKDLFVNTAKKLNIEVSTGQVEKFKKYSELLVEKNKVMNLTSITDDDGIAIKHFIDSILVLSLVEIPENSKIIDVGTGAGFPGIPLKIMREDMEITLLDSLNKRITFLNEVKTALNLEKTVCVHSRAEDGGKNKDLREKFDFSVSRAVAPLKILCEYDLPFVKVGGYFIAMKSAEIDEEIEESRAMIGSLGGKIKEIKEITIPDTDIKRKIVIIEKVKETPKQFPRNQKKIGR
ncbi:MAG: 16S rRNA (guanine(527)-N(7))-methyltransferase RsmG [Clostridia bacterium]|nr:16S rRNA (guanine(527)-N(7))-methyltransferase RsmG [Clostridia bacterium]